MNTDPDSIEPAEDDELRAIAAFIGWSIFFWVLRTLGLIFVAFAALVIALYALLALTGQLR